MNDVGDHGYIGIHKTGGFAHWESYDENAILDLCFYPQNAFRVKIVRNLSTTIKAVLGDYPLGY